MTLPVQRKVFAIQGEDEYRQQFFAWRTDLRKTKTRRSSKQFLDLHDLEKKISRINSTKKRN